MEDVKAPAVKADDQAAAPDEGVKIPLPTDEDYQERIKVLEGEKAQILEEALNYKTALLKEKGRNRENLEDESEDERVRRITREELANSRLTEIDREKAALAEKALKENKELKLALQNKAGVPTSIGSHSESQPVRDTLITPEQLAEFKSRDWSEKDIERYKRNLQKNTR